MVQWSWGSQVHQINVDDKIWRRLDTHVGWWYFASEFYVIFHRYMVFNHNCVNHSWSSGLGTVTTKKAPFSTRFDICHQFDQFRPSITSWDGLRRRRALAERLLPWGYMDVWCHLVRLLQFNLYSVTGKIYEKVEISWVVDCSKSMKGEGSGRVRIQN